MSYKDFFGENRPTPHKTEDEQNITPLSPPTFDTTPVVEKYDVMSFQGFSSGRPLLLERPTKYVNRIVNSMKQIIAIPENDQYGGVEGRVYLSPIFTLPVALLHEGDKIGNETVNRYPYLHFPTNHDWNADEISLDEYLLAIEYMFVIHDIAQESTEGDLLTYGVDGDYTMDDDAWKTACEWSKEISKPLSDLNRGRLLGFAINSKSEKEVDTVVNLFDLWGRNGNRNRFYPTRRLRRVTWKTFTIWCSVSRLNHSTDFPLLSKKILLTWKRWQKSLPSFL